VRACPTHGENLKGQRVELESLEMSKKPHSPGLDGRHRDKGGEIRHKMGNTKIGALRETYGADFAKGWRGDKKLNDLLRDTGAKSLTDFRKNYQGGETRVETLRNIYGRDFAANVSGDTKLKTLVKGYGSHKEFAVRRDVDISKPIFEQANKRAKKDAHR
jgi:hypothetical protein